jgi:hypothetical protein
MMQFKVAAISHNRNSFGLKAVVLIAKSGTAFQVGSNDLHLPKEGDVIDVPLVKGIGPDFGRLGFEIPHRLEVVSQSVVRQVWADPPVA